MLFETEIFVNDALDVSKTNQHWTDEGFLICDNAVFGHVGEQKYHKSEIEIEDSDEEYNVIKRVADDLFSEINMSSLRGKSVTYAHPNNPVNAKNYKRVEIGTVLDSAYRDGDYLKGSFIIKDSAVAKDVWDGKIKGLSLGYKAKVVKDSDGKYKFVDSVNNHIAVVKKPRAKEAYIVDSEYNEIGGEEQVNTKDPQNQNITDTVYTHLFEENTVRKNEYDTNSGEEITVEVITRRYRNKKDENAQLNVGDEENKIENEKGDTNLKTLLELQKEYKEIKDSYDDSPAKDKLLADLDAEALKDYQVSLVPKKVVKDGAFDKVEPKPVTKVEEPKKEVKDERFVEVTDAQKELALEDLYASFNVMDKSFHKNSEVGLDKLNTFRNMTGEALLRVARKVGI